MATMGMSGSGEIHADLAHLTHDPDLIAKIMRKRQAEVERRAKLFDPRTRQFGVAHDVLDGQLDEKKGHAGEAAAEEAYHSRSAILHDQVAQACENVKQQQARDRQISTVNFGLTNLRKDQRREWALSDPQAIKSELPARHGDDDQRLGMSSLQMFAGEDLDHVNRKKDCQNMQKDWLMQQMAEKKAQADADRREDQELDRLALVANEVRAVCEQAARDEQREDKRNEAQDNLNMAAQQRAKREAQMQRGAAQTKAHMDGLMQSDRMTERLDQPRGLDGKLRRPDYKRLTLEQEHDVYATNARLAKDKKDREREEAAEESHHSYNALTGVAVLHALEGEKNRQHLSRRMQMVEHNKAHAEAKRAQEAEDKRRYKSFVHEP